MVVVAAVVVALFPYISATDDVLRIKHYSTQHTNSNGSKHKAGDDLLRLYETLDSPLAYGTCRIVFTVVFFSLLTASIWRFSQRSIPLEAGRSPPLPYPA